MNTRINYGIMILIFLIAPSRQGFTSHTSRMNMQEPVLRGTSGVSVEIGRSNDPWAGSQGAQWNIFGNYNLDLYGMEFPFSFSISRDLQSISLPFAKFGISPSFGWAKLHAGVSRMKLAGISSSGFEFNGGGVELTPGKFRFAGFYGRMASGYDYAPSIPGESRVNYSEKAFGAKIGMGDDEEYVNLSVFSREPEESGKEFPGFSVHCERQMAGFDFGLRLKKGVSLSGGFNLIRTFSDRITWGMEASLGFPAMMGRMNVNLSLFHKKGEEMTESMGNLNMMWLLHAGMLGTNFSFNQIDYHDPGYGMSSRSSAANGSFTYSNFGVAVPFHLSLSAIWNRFSQEYAKSSSLGISLTAGTNLLKTRTLNLGGSAGYNHNMSDQGARREIMLSGNVGYQTGNNLFGFYLNYNRIPGDEVYIINEPAFRKQNTNRMIAGISWSRSF